MTFEKPEHIQWPASLSEKDQELVMAQCENQKATSTEQIQGFATAYAQAKELAHDDERLKDLSEEKLLGLIQEWSELIEYGNDTGYRQVAVRFSNHSQALDWKLVPQAMQRFGQAYVEMRLDALEGYTEFEKIHPYKDGNGRLGDLLWKIRVKQETGSWPTELPPDVFGEKEIS